MLTRIHRVQRLNRCALRSYSTTGYQDIPKLRAFPFRMSPDEAKRGMGSSAAMLAYSDPYTVISSALSVFLPSLFDYKRPKRFVATYFPAWILSAELEVDMTYKNSKWDASSVFFKNTYIPGSHVPTLSAASLWPGTLDGGEPVSFNESLMKQYGEDVQCIPFTVSPFSVLDVAKSSDSLRFSRDLSFSLDSIKTKIFAASPVLIPLYVAQYEAEIPGNVPPTPVTLFIQAHTSNLSCVMTERSALERLDKFLSPKIFKPLNLELDREVVEIPSQEESRLNGSIPSLRIHGYDTDKIFESLEDKLAISSNIMELASARNLQSDLGDFRIRELTQNESQSIENYFDMRHKVLEFQFIRDKIATLPEGNHLLSHQLSPVFHKLEDLEAQEKAAVPHWWTEHQSASSSGADPTSSNSEEKSQKP